MEDNRVELDWVHPPPGTHAMSLWTALHDGELSELRSNLMERSLEATVDSYHIREHFNLGEDFRFHVRFRGVRSARASTWVQFPGDPPDQDQLAPAEIQQAFDEWFAKWRQESIDWARFEEMVNAPGQFFDTRDADMLESHGQISVRLEGYVDHTAHIVVFIAAEGLEVTNPRGAPIDLANWVAWGDSYWEDFATDRDSL